MAVTNALPQTSVDRPVDGAYMGHMMSGSGYYQGMNNGYWPLHQTLGLITWLMLIALMVAATRYLWNKGK